MSVYFGFGCGQVKDVAHLWFCAIRPRRIGEVDLLPEHVLVETYDIDALAVLWNPAGGVDHLRMDIVLKTLQLLLDDPPSIPSVV